MFKTKTLALSALLVFTISCGGSNNAQSSNSDLNAMLSSVQQLDQCTGTTYTAPTTAQITAIENACTTTEISASKTYLGCLAPATCAQDIAAVAACGAMPTLSAQCQAASPSSTSAAP